MGTSDSYTLPIYVFHQKAKSVFQVIQKKIFNNELLLLQYIILVLKPESEMNKKMCHLNSPQHPSVNFVASFNPCNRLMSEIT